MMRPQVIVWLAFFAGAALSSAAMAAPTMHQGKVTAVGKGEVMVLDMKDGEAETFAVTSSTQIMLDAKPAKLVDLQVGFLVEITAEMSLDGKLTAKVISASSKRSPKK